MSSIIDDNARKLVVSYSTHYMKPLLEVTVDSCEAVRVLSPLNLVKTSAILFLFPTWF